MLHFPIHYYHFFILLSYVLILNRENDVMNFFFNVEKIIYI